MIMPTGINLSFAKLLLEKGCDVLIADIALRKEAQELVEKYSGTSTTTAAASSTSATTTATAAAAPPTHPRAVFHRTDVTSWADLSSCFERGISEFTCIDIVCPGAGIYDPHWTNFWHPPSSSSSTSPSRSRDNPTHSRYATLDINLTHPLRLTQLAIAHFLNPPSPSIPKSSPRNPKRILLISSIAGQLPNFHTPLYVAAKHGINGFTRSLAPLDSELGIRVNCVAPGVIKTPLWTDHPEKMAYVDEERDEWASSEEVGEAMVRLLEDEELGGGTVLEVGRGQTRRVEALMDEGPKGKGHTVSRLEEMYGEVFGWLGGEGWVKARL